MNGHEQFMRLAIEQAKRGKQVGGGEVGCVIVKDGKVVAEGYNTENLDFNPTAHAEIVTLAKAGAALRSLDLHGCTLYCTLQPCGMCSLACVWANIDTIVYGAGRRDVDPMYFDERHLNTIDYIHDSYKNSITVIPGVLAGACAALYKRP
jgi:tRNA(adenine34) deaminase